MELNRLILFFFTLILINFQVVSSQTSIDYFNKGIEEHNNQNFEVAIEYYTNSIELDEKNRDAYYNRGSCNLALGNFDEAKIDFSKTIELDSSFTKAYYSRATVFASVEKHKEALPDLNKLIKLQPDFPNALTLRGQIFLSQRRNNEACNDFQKAKKFGDNNAQKYIAQYCTQSSANESFNLVWPENWVIGHEQENEQMKMTELVHSNESVENWTEIGTMIVIKRVKNVPVKKAMNMMYEQALKKAPESKLTFIETDTNSKYPWILFKIESPWFNENSVPESQLYFIVQGTHSMYTNFIAIKEDNIPDELVEKWGLFFKTGTVVND